MYATLMLPQATVLTILVCHSKTLTSWCAVTGPLDTWLPALTALEFIDLSINKFSGNFPCLKNITQLRSVSAGLNRLTGALPTDWLALPEIREIDLAYNR